MVITIINIYINIYIIIIINMYTVVSFFMLKHSEIYILYINSKKNKFSGKYIPVYNNINIRGNMNRQ